MSNGRSAAALALLAATLLSGCDSEPATAVSAIPTVEKANGTTTAQPRPKLRPGAKTKVLAAAGDRAYDKTFDDLRFEMKLDEPFRREMLTDAINSLAGQPIRIRGFILPTAQKSGIRQFVLVRDNQECCFGPGAALFDCILVEMRAGKTADFTIRPVAVSGTFDVREFVVDGRHMAIYHIAGDSVK